MYPHKRSSLDQSMMYQAYAEYIREHEEEAGMSRHISVFPEMKATSISYDELIEVVLGECLKAAGAGYRKLRFDLEYMETGNFEEIDEDGSHYVDVDYFLPQDNGNMCHIQWNSKNSPHLAAEMATTLSRVYGMFVGFPFNGHGADYEVEFVDAKTAIKIKDAVTTKGGYEALMRGVPLDDIVA